MITISSENMVAWIYDFSNVLTLAIVAIEMFWHDTSFDAGRRPTVII